jgi:nondiscriminating aspartyl-tRNA synthetase
MEPTLSTALSARVGERVRMRGWLHHQRQLAQIAFILVRDRTGITQVVITDDELRHRVAQLEAETVIEVEGDAAAVPAAPGGIELHDPTVHVLATAEPSPIDLRRPVLREQLPTQLDHAAVALRHPSRRAVFEVAAASVAGFRAALDAHGFTEINTPKIVARATESGANVFALDYFGQRAFLAQSPQLYKQTMVGVFERVYEIGPAFRAEPHDTGRHLAEYTSLDVELGFIAGPSDVVAVVQIVLAAMVDAVRARATRALELLGVALPAIPATLPSIDFVEAQRRLEAAIGEKVVGEPDLAPAHERWLGEWASEAFGSDVLVVTGFPMAKRPFYTHPDPERPGQSNSFDVLFRGLELITGGQRLHRVADYVAALEARGEDASGYAGYLAAFRHGMPPHGGFAIGLERWVARLVGAANVREATLFPRDRTRLEP